MRALLRVRGKRAPLGLALAPAVVVFAVTPAVAAAAPRIEGVSAQYMEMIVGPPKYVTFTVTTSAARFVSIRWPGHGGACTASVRTRRCFAIRAGSTSPAEFVFDNCRRTRRSDCAGPAERYRVRVGACNRNGCTTRTFRGRFGASP